MPAKHDTHPSGVLPSLDTKGYSVRPYANPYLQLIWPHDSAVSHTLERQVLAGGTERRLADQHLVQDAAEGPEVDGVGDRSSL